MARHIETILLLSLMTLATAKPIMVTFGTHQGPIEPPTQPPPRPAPRTIDVKEPAPVSEQTEDVPNPDVYRPPVPHQYRNKIYAQKPPPNLILGTPIDQKYTPSIPKYEIYKKQGRSEGINYTGPQFFERQAYEVVEEKRKPVSYIKPQFYEKKQEQKTVPQIGVIYSAGVRYYVPQIVYDNNRQDEEQENSVYDSSDDKYVYRGKQ